MIDIVTAISQNEATACGVQIRRPSHMLGVDWQNFWRYGRGKVVAHVDWWSVELFGIKIERPSGITGAEWINFWRPRTILRCAI